MAYEAHSNSPRITIPAVLKPRQASKISVIYTSSFFLIAIQYTYPTEDVQTYRRPPPLSHEAHPPGGWHLLLSSSSVVRISCRQRLQRCRRLQKVWTVPCLCIWLRRLALIELGSSKRVASKEAIDRVK